MKQQLSWEVGCRQCSITNRSSYWQETILSFAFVLEKMISVFHQLLNFGWESKMYSFAKTQHYWWWHLILKPTKNLSTNAWFLAKNKFLKICEKSRPWTYSLSNGTFFLVQRQFIWHIFRETMFKTHKSCLKNAGCNQQSSSAKHPARPAWAQTKNLQQYSTARLQAGPAGDPAKNLQQYSTAKRPEGLPELQQSIKQCQLQIYSYWL